MDLQVVEGPSHGDDYLAAVAGGHTDVLALGLLPLTDKSFGFLRHQPHGSGRDLERRAMSTSTCRDLYRSGKVLTATLVEPQE